MVNSNRFYEDLLAKSQSKFYRQVDQTLNLTDLEREQREKRERERAEKLERFAPDVPSLEEIRTPDLESRQSQARAQLEDDFTRVLPLARSSFQDPDTGFWVRQTDQFDQYLTTLKELELDEKAAERLASLSPSIIRKMSEKGMIPEVDPTGGGVTPEEHQQRMLALMKSDLVRQYSDPWPDDLLPVGRDLTTDPRPTDLLLPAKALWGAVGVYQHILQPWTGTVGIAFMAGAGTVLNPTSITTELVGTAPNRAIFLTELLGITPNPTGWSLGHIFLNSPPPSNPFLQPLKDVTDAARQGGFEGYVEKAREIEQSWPLIPRLLAEALTDPFSWMPVGANARVVEDIARTTSKAFRTGLKVGPVTIKPNVAYPREAYAERVAYTTDSVLNTLRIASRDNPELMRQAVRDFAAGRPVAGSGGLLDTGQHFMLDEARDYISRAMTPEAFSRQVSFYSTSKNEIVIANRVAHKVVIEPEAIFYEGKDIFQSINELSNLVSKRLLQDFGRAVDSPGWVANWVGATNKAKSILSWPWIRLNGAYYLNNLVTDSASTVIEQGIHLFDVEGTALLIKRLGYKGYHDLLVDGTGRLRPVWTEAVHTGSFAELTNARQLVHRLTTEGVTALSERQAKFAQQNLPSLVNDRASRIPHLQGLSKRLGAFARQMDMTIGPGRELIYRQFNFNTALSKHWSSELRRRTQGLVPQDFIALMENGTDDLNAVALRRLAGREPGTALVEFTPTNKPLLDDPEWTRLSREYRRSVLRPYRDRIASKADTVFPTLRRADPTELLKTVLKTLGDRKELGRTIAPNQRVRLHNAVSAALAATKADMPLTQSEVSRIADAFAKSDFNRIERILAKTIGRDIVDNRTIPQALLDEAAEWSRLQGFPLPSDKPSLFRVVAEALTAREMGLFEDITEQVMGSMKAVPVTGVKATPAQREVVQRIIARFPFGTIKKVAYNRLSGEYRFNTTTGTLHVPATDTLDMPALWRELSKTVQPDLTGWERVAQGTSFSDAFALLMEDPQALKASNPAQFEFFHTLMPGVAERVHGIPVESFFPARIRGSFPEIESFLQRRKVEVREVVENGKKVKKEFPRELSVEDFREAVDMVDALIDRRLRENLPALMKHSSPNTMQQTTLSEVEQSVAEAVRVSTKPKAREGLDTIRAFVEAEQVRLKQFSQEITDLRNMVGNLGFEERLANIRAAWVGADEVVELRRVEVLHELAKKGMAPAGKLAEFEDLYLLTHNQLALDIEHNRVKYYAQWIGSDMDADSAAIFWHRLSDANTKANQAFATRARPILDQMAKALDELKVWAPNSQEVLDATAPKMSTKEAEELMEKVGIPVWARPSTEHSPLELFKGWADEMRVEARGALARMKRAMQETLDAGPVAQRITEEQLGAAVRGLNDAIAAAEQRALMDSQHLLFTYNKNTMDYLLNGFAPYPYWGMRYMLSWTTRMFRDPRKAELLMRTIKAWYEDTKERPRSEWFTARLLTMDDGTEIRWRPWAFFFPLGYNLIDIVHASTNPEKEADWIDVASTTKDAIGMRLYPWWDMAGGFVADQFGGEELTEQAGYGFFRPLSQQAQYLTPFNRPARTAVGSFFPGSINSGALRRALLGVAGGDAHHITGRVRQDLAVGKFGPKTSPEAQQVTSAIIESIQQGKVEEKPIGDQFAVDINERAKKYVQDFYRGRAPWDLARFFGLSTTYSTDFQRGRKLFLEMLGKETNILTRAQEIQGFPEYFVGQEWVYPMDAPQSGPARKRWEVTRDYNVETGKVRQEEKQKLEELGRTQANPQLRYEGYRRISDATNARLQRAREKGEGAGAAITKAQRDELALALGGNPLPVDDLSAAYYEWVDIISSPDLRDPLTGEFFSSEYERRMTAYALRWERPLPDGPMDGGYQQILFNQTKASLDMPRWVQEMQADMDYIRQSGFWDIWKAEELPTPEGSYYITTEALKFHGARNTYIEWKEMQESSDPALRAKAKDMEQYNAFFRSLKSSYEGLMGTLRKLMRQRDPKLDELVIKWLGYTPTPKGPWG